MGKRIDSKYWNGKAYGRQGNTYRYVIMQVIYLAISITMGFLLLHYMDNTYGELNGEAIFAFYASIAMYILCNYLQLIIHEAGHLLFGLLTGYKFLSFRIYSRTFVKKDGKLTCKKRSIPGTVGQCLMVPPKEDGTDVPCILYNLGGIILNFLTAFAAVIVILLMPKLPLFLRFLLIVFAAAGILDGVINGLPVKFFGVANDGFNVRSLLKEHAARRSFLLQLMIADRLYNGIRLKELPTEWLELPEGANPANIMNTYILFMAYNRELDRLDFIKAEQLLREIDLLLPKLPASFRNSVNLGFLFLALVNGESREKVKRFLTRQTKSLIKSSKNEINIRRIAYAYYLLYEKNEKAAGQALNKLKELAGKYPIPAEAEMNLMLAEHLQVMSQLKATENMQKEK
jgi:hypothetical protein